jgi:hypothetical protein
MPLLRVPIPVICIVFWIAFNATAARADFTFASDVIVSGTYETISGSASHGVSLRTHNQMLLGEEGFRYGLGFQFEMPSSDTKEYIVGAAIQLGSRFIFGLGAGYLLRDFGGYNETGLGGWVQPGFALPLSESFDLRITVPVIFKFVTSGIATKIVMDYVPYLGIGLHL